MVSSDLGACEWFVWDLRRSGLIDRGQLDQVVGEYLTRSPRAEPPALAEYLVKQQVLSPFQAERILQGKTQGLVLGPYVLMDAIGSGSMGQVYRASSKTDNQSYAVKVLPRRSMWNVRLARRQVRAFGQFSHPAVVPFVDVGTSGGQHYLVWPLVEGETLEARVQRQGKLAPDAAAAVMSQVAQGLAAAHANGLFHGLIKPSNILIGSDGQVRILDFGIGSLLVENEGESLVDTMSTANTLTSGLDCSSPESIMEPTNRTQAGDQYSFGCVLYYCMAGRYPFADGTAVEKMMAHQFKQPTPIRELVPNIPDGMVTVVERLMQKSPEARYNGVDEIVEALLPYAGEMARKAAILTSAQASRPGGSHHGSHFGTAFPTMAAIQVPGSQFGGSRVSFTPIPGNQPGLPSGSHVPTPQTGPLTPIPSSGHGEPIRPSHIPTARPAPSKPGYGSAHGEMATALPISKSRYPAMNEQALPIAMPVESASSKPKRLPAGPGTLDWEEPQKAGGTSVLLVFLVAALVTTGVYLLGKNFLFTG
jgi:serine/threonine-protein kinase